MGLRLTPMTAFGFNRGRSLFCSDVIVSMLVGVIYVYALGKCNRAVGVDLVYAFPQNCTRPTRCMNGHFELLKGH